MKALSALRQVFSLKKNEELGRKFSHEDLKRIVDAMKEYAASKLQEQRAFVSVNLSWPMTPAKVIWGRTRLLPNCTSCNP